MTLASACRDHQHVRFGYADKQHAASTRAVEPHGLVHTGARWYLVAWDLDRSDWRTFRVDRIQDEPRPGARFMPRQVPQGDLAAYVSRSIASGVYRVSVRVVVHAPLARVTARVPPLAGYVQRIDDESCLLESGAHSFETLAFYITLLGEEFEVQRPAEFVETLERLAGRLSRAAARSRSA
jgi:predicted DNA-binding transcriptional regulator YafY